MDVQKGHSEAGIQVDVNGLNTNKLLFLMKN